MELAGQAHPAMIAGRNAIQDAEGAAKQNPGAMEK